ncbi:hypothetical protein [Streptomyces sp. NPDC046712]|uniref:hypothetical protein n=1 Tax=Streptomyces sp. NPDC046712 TaxID=3154802 RepID=UPI0033F45FB2
MVVPGGGAVAVRGGGVPGVVPGREVPGVVPVPVPLPVPVSVPVPAPAPESVPVPLPGGAGVAPGVVPGGRGDGDDVLEVVPLADGLPSSGISVTDPDGRTASFGVEPAPTAA